MASELELRDSGNNGCKNRGMGKTGGVEKIFFQLSVRRQEITSQKQWQLHRARVIERKIAVVLERGFQSSRASFGQLAISGARRP